MSAATVQVILIHNLLLHIILTIKEWVVLYIFTTLYLRILFLPPISLPSLSHLSPISLPSLSHLSPSSSFLPPPSSPCTGWRVERPSGTFCHRGKGTIRTGKPNVRYPLLRQKHRPPPTPRPPQTQNRGPQQQQDGGRDRKEREWEWE